MLYDRLKAFGRAVVFPGSKKRNRAAVVVTPQSVTFEIPEAPLSSTILAGGVSGIALTKEDRACEPWQVVRGKHKDAMEAEAKSVVVVKRDILLKVLETFDSAAVALEFSPSAVKLDSSTQMITADGNYIASTKTERSCDVLRVRELRSPDIFAANPTACIVGVVRKHSAIVDSPEHREKATAGNNDTKKALIERLQKNRDKRTKRRG